MGKLHARARIIQDFEIVLDNDRSYALIVNQPTEAFPGLGPTPLELVRYEPRGMLRNHLRVDLAQKMRLPLKGCDVKVEAVKSPETGTISEESFDIVFKVDAPKDRVQRLHELTLKNCPVGILFEKAGVKINYSLRTVKE